MDAQFKVICNHTAGNPVQQFILVDCPRCLGTGFYNALSWGTDGKVITVSGFPKLAQQIQKILTENKRSTGYGFDYSVMTDTINPGTLTAIKSEVARCMAYLQINQRQEQSEGFFYLPSEQIVKLISLDVQIDPSDPRGVFVNVSVQTLSNTKNGAVQVYLRG